MTDLRRWNEIKAIAQEALDRPEHERTRYLEEACGGDEELRREVAALLAVSSTRADFFDHFQVFPPGMQRPDLTEGDIVGHYRIIRTLGQGGMGSVYLAQDTEVDRKVALKILPRRLTQEQELHARLQHPNIAIFFDSGTTQDGFGYFAMEYVEGEPVTDYCVRQGLSVEERLTLFLQVCDAVAFAHRNLVVHRDIKPSNILVDAEGKPKLLDFGIAKLLPSGEDLLTLTRPEERSLTLAFASPEQLEGERTTTATDIYSLGVLLCLLLTGRLPYPIKTYHDLPWAIRNMEPEKPSRLVLRDTTPDDQELLPTSVKDKPEKLSRILRGDLDAIVLKTLRKEPERRYATVAELAKDVRRFLVDEPVSAVRGSTRYKARKFVRRHTSLVAGTLLTAAIIIGLIVGLFFEQRETARQRDVARLAAARSDQLSRFLISIFDLGDPFRHLTTPPSLSELLAQSVRQLRSGKLNTPEDKVLFSETLARIYSAQGNYKMSLSLYKEALEGVRANTSSSYAHQARLLTQIAAVRIDLGQLPEARQELNQARILQQSAPFVPPADIARRLLVSGRERSFSGAFIEALRFFSNALPLVANITEEQGTVATIHEELAASLNSVGQFDGALRNVNRALDIAKRLYQNPHPAIAKILMSRAEILGMIGRYEEASKDLQEAEAVLSSSLGPSHPAVSDVLENRGALAIEQQNFDRAIHYFTTALELRTRILGPTHLETIRAYQRLGEAIQGKGDLPKAESMLRKALANHERFGGDRTSISLLLNNLGLLLLQRGNTSEARVLLERALHIREQTHGKNSCWVAVTRGNLSNLYYQIGRNKEAIKETKETIQLIKASVGSQHYYVANGLNNLGFFYAIQGNYSAAIPPYREALSIENKLGLGDSLLATYSLTNLADALLETGQLQEAYRHIQRAQTILRRKSDPGLPQRDVADGIEGKYHLLRGAYSDAEAKLTSSFEGLRTKTGLQSQQTQAALRRLILLYERWGKPAKIAEYRKLLAEAASRAATQQLHK